MRKVVGPVLMLFVLVFFLPVVKKVHASSILCHDNFSTPGSCIWEKITPAFATFSLADNLEGTAQYLGTEDSGFYLTGDLSWSDYLVEAKIFGATGVDKTIIGRFVSRDNYYLLDLRSPFGGQGNDLVLAKACCNGHRKLIGRATFINENNHWYKLGLQFIGNKITVFVDDEKLFTYEDDQTVENPPRSGRAGLAIWGGNYEGINPLTKNFYTDFTVTAKTPEQMYVLIPGLGASWNPVDIASCNLQNSHDWSIAPYARNVYGRLRQTLVENAQLTLGKNYFEYGYDWRQPMSQQAQGLEKYLLKITHNNPTAYQINLIGHSLGGLVIKSYLERYPQSDFTFSKIITVGTPHLGTPFAYPLWENAEIAKDDLVMKIALETLLAYCQSIENFASKKEVIQQNALSLKDLLPIFPYLEIAGILKPIEEMAVQNDWLKSVNIDAINKQLIMIAGEGLATLEKIIATHLSSGGWSNGEPLTYAESGTGDETILTKSAVIQNSGKNELVPGTTHVGLVYDDLGIKAILKNLDLNSNGISEQKTQQPSYILSAPKLWQKYQPIVWKRYKLRGK